MFPILQIAIGGGAGAVCRYGVTIGVGRILGVGHPVGTLCANVVGSLLIGVLFVLMIQKTHPVPHGFSPLVITGFLGGFTTFSAFSLDAMKLVEQDKIGAAAAYIGGSVGLSILALCAGLWFARSVLS